MRPVIASAVGPLPERSGARALSGVLRRFGVVVLPLVVAAIAVRALLPPAGAGIAGEVAILGRRYPFALGIALYLLFAAIARYWLDRALAPTRELPARTPEASRRRLTSSLALVAIAAGAALLLREAVRPYHVEGASMLPTLEPGDMVAGVTSRDHVPRRGDVLVFHSRADRKRGNGEVDLVKRVIGLPGDRISMRGPQPVINGWPVPSCDAGEYLYITRDGEQAVRGRLRVEFLGERAYLAVFAMTRPFAETYLVKPGEVFVLGDDRGNSFDSREYGGGQAAGLPSDAVVARVDRFVLGTHRGGDVDFGRFLRNVDGLSARPTLDVDAPVLAAGVARCLAERPAVTVPPPPEQDRSVAGGATF